MSYDYWEDLIVAHKRGEHITPERARYAIGVAATGAYEGFVMAGYGERKAQLRAVEFAADISRQFTDVGIVH